MKSSISPAAQAVLDAYKEASDGHYIDGEWVQDHAGQVAAALRAAADQVVSEPPMLVPGGRSYEAAWTATVQDAIRRDLLAIAAELEGTTG